MPGTQLNFLPSKALSPLTLIIKMCPLGAGAITSGWGPATANYFSLIWTGRDSPMCRGRPGRPWVASNPRVRAALAHGHPRASETPPSGGGAEHQQRPWEDEAGFCTCGCPGQAHALSGRDLGENTGTRSPGVPSPPTLGWRAPSIFSNTAGAWDMRACCHAPLGRAPL